MRTTIRRWSSEPLFDHFARRDARRAKRSADWVVTALDEYRSLRSESLQAIDRLLRVLGLGTTAPGVVLGLGVEAGIGSSTASLLLIVLSPLLALVLCVFGLGEMERIVHVASHVASLEKRISQRIDPSDPPLSWESALRDNPTSRRRSFNVYRANFTIIFLLAMIGAVLGNIGLARHTSSYAVGVATSFDVFVLLTLVRTVLCAEYRLRGLAGQVWTTDNIPFLAKLFRYERQLLRASQLDTAVGISASVSEPAEGPGDKRSLSQADIV